MQGKAPQQKDVHREKSYFPKGQAFGATEYANQKVNILDDFFSICNDQKVCGALTPMSYTVMLSQLFWNRPSKTNQCPLKE